MHTHSQGDERLETGVVFRKARGLYDVRTDGGVVQCSISNKLRKRLLYPTSDPSSGTSRAVQRVEDTDLIDPVAIGDRVSFAPAEPGHGQIREVEPRRNRLARKVLDPKRRHQANPPFAAMVPLPVECAVRGCTALCRTPRPPSMPTSTARRGPAS